MPNGEEDEGETHSRRPSLVVALICKHATCSGPDLPPSSVFPPFAPSAVEVKLEDAMNTCKHPVTVYSLGMLIRMMPLAED